MQASNDTATVYLGASSFLSINSTTGTVLSDTGVPSSSLPPDNGLNGLASVVADNGRYVLGAAMPGLLTLLNVTEAGAPPVSLGALDQRPHKTYDVALLAPPTGEERHAVTVDASGSGDSLLRVVRISANGGRTILSPAAWREVGVLKNPHRYGGCNRVRIVANRVAVFSCVKRNVVGFADLGVSSAPRLLKTVPFVDEQPTGT